MNRKRLEPEELHARLIAAVGIILAGVFAVIVIGFVWGLLFVSQPIEQSPNDAAFIDMLSTIVVFMTGTLSGLVASNGIKKKAENNEPEPE
jgi:ABC-type transport system involved in multi-copper enzyme maturation permease subunit